ncbi:hypothetical protein LguiA_030797 [Lonicera macranthoides]
MRHLVDLYKANGLHSSTYGAGDDSELDSMLKERLRWGDLMAHLVKKKYTETVLPDMRDNDKMKELGFIIPQDVPSHSWLKRGLDAAPNHYEIKPGRNWAAQAWKDQ